MQGKINLFRTKWFILLQWLVFSFLIFLVLFATPSASQAQQNLSPNAAYSQTDVENLYQQCKQVREDTVGRICISFLDQHRIRKDNVPAFYAFCKDFISHCKTKGNKALSRRMAIIELYGHLRFDSATAQYASTAFENLHESYIIQKDYAAAQECLFELSQYLHLKSEPIKSLQVLFYAEKFAHKHNLQHKISYHGVLYLLGYKLWQLNKPQQSNEYFKKALQTGNSNNRDSLIELNGIGMNYQKLDSLQQSLYYFAEARKVAIAGNNEVFNTVILGSTAATLLKMGEVDKAYEYSMQYKKLSIQYPLWENAVDAFCNLIQIELKRNNISHAKILLDSLNKIMSHIKSSDLVLISNKRQKEVNWLYYEHQKLFEPALAAHKEYMYYDSLFQDYSNKNKISELELNAAAKVYEQEMFEKEQNRIVKDWLKTGIVVVVLITMCILSVWGFKKIKKAQQQKAETEIINQQQATEIEILKEQLLNQLAAIRTHNAGYEALAAQNLEYAPNKENINDTALPATIVAENDICLDNESTPIQLLMAFDLTQKEQWKDFKKLFSKTYPEFEQQIVIKVGPVSAAELRLMMLLKLGLNNKQIAQTLLITIDGVKKAKYRLYKKIGVSSTEEMNEFLG